MHHKDVCQYGFVHAQCRCPGDKIVNNVQCDNPSHAEPVDLQPSEMIDRETLEHVDRTAKGLD